MKNLLNHLSLEKIEEIPTGRFRGRVVNGKTISRGWWSEKNYNSRASKLMYRKIKRLIIVSVGQKWDDIFSKICAMTKGINYDFSIYWPIESLVEFPYWNKEFGRWHHLGRWRSSDLYNDIRDIKEANPIYYTSDLYYVCPFTGILACVKPPKGKGLSIKEIRNSKEKHAKFLKEKRVDKILRKQKGLAELSLINKPELYKFYIRLTGRRKQLLETITKHPDSKPVMEIYKTFYMPYRKVLIDNPKQKWLKRIKDWEWSEKRRIRDAANAKLELVGIQSQIDSIERGEYNIFFESNAYLYSLQKECHHF